MSRLQVFSAAPDGTDRVCLDTLGLIYGLRLSTSINGDLGLTWQMQLDPRSDHAALQPGRLVTVPVSATATWEGRMLAPQRGQVWQFSADGRSTEPGRWAALDTTAGNNATNLNEVVDEAIARGWSVARGTLPTLTDGAQPSGTLMIRDALDQVTGQLNQWWKIGRGTGKLTAFTLPTALTYVLLASDTAGGRTATNFVTDVIVLYTDSSDYTTKTLTRSNTAARAKWGRVEAPYDLTSYGPLTTTQAQAGGDNYLSVNAPRLKFTGAFTVTPGQLLATGTPVELAIVKAGVLVRVLLTDPDAAAGELGFGPIQIVLGQTDYDVDSDVLTLTPLDTQPTGLANVLKLKAA